MRAGLARRSELRVVLVSTRDTGCFVFKTTGEERKLKGEYTRGRAPFDEDRFVYLIVETLELAECGTRRVLNPLPYDSLLSRSSANIGRRNTTRHVGWKHYV